MLDDVDLRKEDLKRRLAVEGLVGSAVFSVGGVRYGFWPLGRFEWSRAW